jgi:hypothetical protein
VWWRELAEQQHGLITWRQGVVCVGEDRMEADVRAGRIVRTRPSVYFAAGAPATLKRELLAACFAGRGVASHRAAAWLHGFPGIACLRPEIITGPERHVRLEGVRAHRSTFLPSEHLTIVDGIPCTTPARTALDMSALLGDDSVKRMLTQIHQRDIVSYAAVVEVLGVLRRRGRRRVAHLAPILDYCLAVDDKSESDGERWAVRTLVKAGFRPPEQQIWVVANGKRYCIDVGYSPEKVGVDFDGYWAHGTTRRAFDYDRERVSELELAGWLMLLVTSSTTASELVDRVGRALARHRPTSGQ